MWPSQEPLVHLHDITDDEMRSETVLTFDKDGRRVSTSSHCTKRLKYLWFSWCACDQWFWRENVSKHFLSQTIKGILPVGIGDQRQAAIVPGNLP